MSETTTPQPSLRDRHITPEMELTQLAVSINNRFSEGDTAFDLLADLRKFPLPICVDFNNVLANNSDPFLVNPDAKEFLDQLRELGNIFIVTTAEDQEGVRDFCEQHGIWSDDIVLMAKPTWYFMTNHAENMSGVPGKHADSLYERERELKSKADIARQEYIDLMAGEGKNFGIDDFNAVPAGKTIAPLFAKRWPVPIIDDSTYATRNNPNMFGVNVQAWEPNDPSTYRRSNEGVPTILDAVPLIRKHFEQLEAENKLG